MHIHQNMYGYWNAVWGAPAKQADGTLGARWSGSDGGANGAPVTQNAPENAAPTGGNRILQALAQALESLGLTLSTPAANATSAPPATSSGASTTTTAAATTSTTTAAAATAVAAPPTTPASSVSGTATASPAPVPSPAPPLTPWRGHEVSSEERTIAGDVRHLMHALFEDVRAENLLAPSSSSASGSPTPGASFASGLAALISQVQSGSAPANLQRAFDALVTNLTQVGTQPAPATGNDSGNTATGNTATATAGDTASTSTAAPASTLNTQALLVQFLTNLQTDLGLGYGGSTATPAQSATSGVMVNTAA